MLPTGLDKRARARATGLMKEQERVLPGLDVNVRATDWTGWKCACYRLDWIGMRVLPTGLDRNARARATDWTGWDMRARATDLWQSFGEPRAHQRHRVGERVVEVVRC